MNNKPNARQLVALNHISHGRNIDQTADAMCLSRSSVEKLLGAARKRINAKTLTHAVSMCIRAGLICVLIVVSLGGNLEDKRARTARSRRRESEFEIVRLV